MAIRSEHPTFVFYISGHGFGHATRSIEIVNALARRAPAARFVLRTIVPEWFLRAGLGVEAQIIPGDTDTGVVQPDSLSVDEEETARRAAAFYARFDERVAREAAFLARARGALVVGDIPPLAFAAAAEAGIPSVAFGNFTWDWIYGGLPRFDQIAPGVRGAIAKADARATLALRLPFGGGFEGMPHVDDVPLVARRASLAREETRARLRLPGGRPIVLATFGGHGGTVPLANAARNGAFLLLATDYEVPSAPHEASNLRVVPADEMRGAGVAYTDLLAASDVVVSKLGYGIVSECLANGVALLYTLRGRFIEQEVFIQELPDVMRIRLLPPGALSSGRWSADVAALLGQPLPSRTIRIDGADVVADRLLALLPLA